MPQSGYSSAGQRAITSAEVLIRIFYPNGDSLAITNPEDFNHKQGTLYVKAEGKEWWYHGLPYDIMDARNALEK